MLFSVESFYFWKSGHVTHLKSMRESVLLLCTDCLFSIFHTHHEHLGSVIRRRSGSLAIKDPTIVLVQSFYQFTSALITVDKHGGGSVFTVLSQMVENIGICGMEKSERMSEHFLQ